MKKKAIYNYFNDEEYQVEDSPYDFSAVDLRGENHRKDLDDNFDDFSFDDDSYGDLPFEDDFELVEEDFSIRNITENDDRAFLDDDGRDIDDEHFVLDRPDDAPDFTEDFLEDENDDSVDVKPGKSDSSAGASASVVVPHVTLAATVQSVALPVESATAGPKRIIPKMRNSALQPLLVLNRSKHSFDPTKKNAKSAEEDVFDDYDEGHFSDFDDDIEDISAELDTEEYSEELAETDDTVSEIDEEESSAVVPELSEEEIVAEKTSDEEPENVSEENPSISEDHTEDSIGDVSTVSGVEDAEDDSGERGIAEEIPDASAVLKKGKIFFDDFDDMVSTDDIIGTAPADKSIFGSEQVATGNIFSQNDVEVIDEADEIDEPVEIEEVKSYNDTATEALLDSQEDSELSHEESSIDERIKERKLARKKQKRKKKVKNLVKEVFSWTGVVVAAFLIAIVINLYVARPSVVSGRSMMPTLENGDTIIISKLPYMLGDVEYGDIVVIDRQVNRERTFAVEVMESLKYNVLTQSLFDENELTEDTFWVKRIIGLPGDIIEFYEGKVYRNGELLKEDYIYTQEVGNYPNGEQFVVQEGCIFVMGDNRNESLDSRILALHEEQIAMDHIVGKLISK